MTESARDKVLSISETFEVILLHLDTGTLLTKAQLICRTWTTFIQDSPAIQWALFFKPVKTSMRTHQNPLLAEMFPSVFSRENGESNGNLTFTTFVMIRNPHKMEAWIRPEASWRKMLVQQPPLYKLSLLYTASSFYTIMRYW